MLRGQQFPVCAYVPVLVCVLTVLFCRAGDKDGIIPCLAAIGSSDLSLKHLVLASVRAGVLTPVSQRVWQFPCFQALDRSRLFSSIGWLVFLTNTDSQMSLSHSLVLLTHNLRLKVRG